MVELKRLHIVRSKGKEYVYAWRGGPRIDAPRGTPEFMRAYNAAIEEHRIPNREKFRAQIQLYRGSEAFKKLAPTTRKIWGRWLDTIEAHFGILLTKNFDRADVIKPRIRKWLATYADRPRSHDYAKQVLSRVLSFVVDQGEITSNPCEGIKSTYATDRSEIIWTDDDIQKLREKASPEVMQAVELAAATGLRSADIFRLAWSHIHDDAIIIKTSKSRFKREAIIPLYDELRDMLASIPRRSTIVLTNGDGRPWRGFSSSFTKAMERAGMADRDLHFHDLRGTAATRFYLAGLSIRTIAEIMGWEEDAVDRIIRRYVGRQAAVQEAIETMRARSVSVARDDGYEIVGRAGAQSTEAMLAGSGIYFIKGRTSDRIKIGIAGNAIGRIKELAIGSSETLMLMAVIKGDRKDEAFLHYHFRKHRVKGEWFEATEQLTALIEAVSHTDDFDWRAMLATDLPSAEVIPLER